MVSGEKSLKKMGYLYLYGVFFLIMLNLIYIAAK